MKTRYLFLAMLVALSSTALAIDSDKPGMTVVSAKGSEVFKVIYRGGTVGKVKLNIFDNQGRMIHTEAIKGLNGFIVPVNFRGLPSGAYTIEVMDGNGNHREKINYLPLYELKSIHVSKILTEKNKFLLAISDAQNEPITVKIYDAAERVLFDKRTVIDGDFAQVFNIAKGHGRYTFEISDARGNKKHFSF